MNESMKLVLGPNSDQAIFGILLVGEVESSHINMQLFAQSRLPEYANEVEYSFLKIRVVMHMEPQ